MTNFERIKAMDKEEMADFLDDFQLGEYDFASCDGNIPEWLELDCDSLQGIDYWCIQQQQDFMRMVQEADYEIC